MNRSTITIISVLSIILSFFVGACSDKKSEDLKTHIQAEYTTPTKKKKLTSGSKALYLETEQSMNQAYVRSLDSILNTAFDRQIETFEENELGVIAGYKHMFSWLFQSKQSWDDDMKVLSNKYFNNLDIQQEQHALYTSYVTDIKNLREQFITANGLPAYTQIDLPSDKITLESLSDHTRNNILIEFSTQLFEWFIGFIILQIILLFVDKIAGPFGCLIDIIVFIIIIVISVLMSNSNDSKLMDSLREQHMESVEFNSDNLLNTLDANTIKFYENLR